MILFVIGVWCVLSFAISSYGERKEIGYWGTFACCLFLSPLIGLIIAAISKDKVAGSQPLSANISAMIINADWNLNKGLHDEALKVYMEIVTSVSISPQSYYKIAAIYSIKGDVENSYKYLDKAVQQGFNDFEKIKTFFFLKSLGADKDFQQFALNGYRLIKASITNATSKFDELEKLGKLKESGVISQEEFEKEKGKILN